jgi:hypothetical protein
MNRMVQTLVALEYAVCALLAQAPRLPGRRDAVADLTFQLWTLHAWIGRANPASSIQPISCAVRQGP